MSAVTTTRWNAGADVGDLAFARAAGRLPSARTWRSTAVFRPLKLKSRSPFSCGRVPVGMRQARRRQRDRAIVAGSGETVDDRTARVAEAEQLRDLVVRLARRIVARPAEELVSTRAADQVQARVPARDDEDDRRQRQLAVLRARATRCGRPGGARRRAAGRRGGGGLRERHADEQRADEARALGDGDRAEIAPTSPPPRSSARSTTPQMSRMCCRDASSGTTPPHSR